MDGMEYAQRFWSKVKKGDKCWEWLGCFYPNGRPAFWLDGQNRQAYRIAYHLTIGPIPNGMHLDHTCNNKACVNPSHLQPSTARDNVLRSMAATGINARKIVCKRGHPFSPWSKTGKNAKKGWRQCVICDRNQQRLRRAELRLWAWYGKHVYSVQHPDVEL